MKFVTYNIDAVIKEHRDHHPIHWIQDIDAGMECCACMLPEYGNRSCLPYQLAEQLKDERAKIERIRSVLMDLRSILKLSGDF